MSEDDLYADYNSDDLEDEDYEPLEIADDGDDDRGNWEKEEPVYKIINKKSLLSAQLEDLRKVADVLRIRMHHARTLLIYHRWDVESLFGKLADQGEERVFLSAGLPARTDAEHAVPLEITKGVSCRICFLEVEGRNATRMDCGHAFCNDCWTQYFIIKIQEGQSRRITCMEEKCKAICDEDKVWDLVSAVDGEAAERFERSLLESYIEDNSKVKWCPSVPHCGNAISVEGEPYCELECACSHQFCFNCLSEPHSPCSCQMWRLWDQKCKDESETVNWLTAHTKPCPKCGKPVEKNGGCNLVGCICGQAFCWLCGVATGREHTWTSIQGHSCGRYKEEKEKEAEKAQRDLKRYIHYHSRWKGHMDSLKLEEKKREEAQAKIAKQEASESLVKDYTWLTNGLQRLFRARRALSYSYAFAYYMFGNDIFKDDISEHQNDINQNLFEDQQQQLENTVEKLSKLVETNLEFNADDDEVHKIRMDVINLTALTDTLCRRMYDVIENDLLGSLELTTHHIAPYRSQGYERVAEVPDAEDEKKVSHFGPSAKHRRVGYGDGAGPSSLSSESLEQANVRPMAEPSKASGKMPQGLPAATSHDVGSSHMVPGNGALPTSGSCAAQSEAVTVSDSSQHERLRRERSLKRPAAEGAEMTFVLSPKRRGAASAISPAGQKTRAAVTLTLVRRTEGRSREDGGHLATVAHLEKAASSGRFRLQEIGRRGGGIVQASSQAESLEAIVQAQIATGVRVQLEPASEGGTSGGIRSDAAGHDRQGHDRQKEKHHDCTGRGERTEAGGADGALGSNGESSGVEASRICMPQDSRGVRQREDALGGSNVSICPVCCVAFEQSASNESINAHIDQCLATIQ